MDNLVCPLRVGVPWPFGSAGDVSVHGQLRCRHGEVMALETSRAHMLHRSVGRIQAEAVDHLREGAAGGVWALDEVQHRIVLPALATACPMIGAAGRRGTCADIAMERGSKTAVCVFMHTRPRGPAQWLSVPRPMPERPAPA